MRNQKHKEHPESAWQCEWSVMTQQARIEIDFLLSDLGEGGN